MTGRYCYSVPAIGSCGVDPHRVARGMSRLVEAENRPDSEWVREVPVDATGLAGWIGSALAKAYLTMARGEDDGNPWILTQYAAVGE